jgi:hypothetical protein
VDGGFSRQFQGHLSGVNGILAQHAINLAVNTNRVPVAIDTLSPYPVMDKWVAYNFKYKCRGIKK